MWFLTYPKFDLHVGRKLQGRKRRFRVMIKQRSWLILGAWLLLVIGSSVNSADTKSMKNNAVGCKSRQDADKILILFWHAMMRPLRNLSPFAF
jgi:hypothetical protein